MSDLVSIQTGPISVNSWIVPLAGNAVFLVDPAGSKVTGDDGAITGYLDEHHLYPVAIVLTHGHFDHVIGLPVIHQAYQAVRIAIHKNDTGFIGPDSALWQAPCLSAIGGQSILQAVSGLPAADEFLEDAETLAAVFPEEYCQSVCKNAGECKPVYKALAEWMVIHTPGHTPGSVCLYNKTRKVLISGDTVFYQSFGRTDLFMGSQTDLEQSISRLSEIVPHDTLVYPGHDYSGFQLSESI